MQRRYFLAFSLINNLFGSRLFVLHTLQTLSTENRRTTISNSKRQEFLPFQKRQKF
jgi:hypothetical protein